MKQHEDVQKRARAERVYAWFLHLYPGVYRRTFGQQMLQTFQDHYRDAIETVGESELRFWLGVAGDEGRSLVREHAAALRENIFSLKKGFFIAPVVGLLLLVLALSFTGPILRPLLGLMIEGLILALYAALLVILMGYVRTFSRSGIRPLWGRLGLVLGGIYSLYVIASNVTSVLMPAPSDVGSGAILLTLPPLLMGLVGLIGGYTSGRTRTGTFAGLSIGFIGLVVGQVSWLLLVVLLWHAIQHGALQSGLEMDFQRDVQNSGGVPSLWSFLNWEIFGDGIGFPVMVGLIILTIEGLCATVGGAIGAALRRSDSAEHQVALPTTTPIGFILTIPVLFLLIWAGSAEFQSLGGQHRLLALNDLGSSFTSPSGVSWLLGFLVVLAFVFVSARLNPSRPETSATSR